MTWRGRGTPTRVAVLHGDVMDDIRLHAAAVAFKRTEKGEVDEGGRGQLSSVKLPIPEIKKASNA